MKIKYYLVLIIFSFTHVNCGDSNNSVKSDRTDKIYVASYNVQNLFDTIDHPEKIDEWFTPESEINWTNERLNLKIKNLAKVIEYLNNGDGPDLIGLQEVENKSVLEDLVKSISLKRNYKIVHYDSPDMRGIDNAVIYDANVMELVKSEPVEVLLDEDDTSRDILFCRMKLSGLFVDFYVNHWPSRRDGLKKTEKKRVAAAKTLVDHISLVSDGDLGNIIIMGDFNDLPSNISISKVLKADKFECGTNIADSLDFLNLSYQKFQLGEGTYKFRDNWNMLDQIIISRDLSDNHGIDYVCESFEIIKPEFLLQKEGKYKGTSLPTYGGRKYLAGYSDHFAIGAKFVIQDE